MGAVRRVILAAVCATVFAGPAAAAPPANDDFGASIVISGDAGTLTANSAEATVQDGEPYHAGETGGASVWYTLVASPGEYLFETCGSTIDTLLAVYTGDAFPLAEQDSSDDACGTGSRVVLEFVTAGTVLRIAVDDAFGDGGPFVLTWRRTDHSPVNTSPPTISGSVQEGQTLTAQPGTWTARRTPHYSYRWERCDEAGGNCISSGIGATRVLRDTDVGRTFRVRVTASNIDGRREAVSAPTARVVALPPRNTGPPEIAGTARVGESLFVTSAGRWDGAVTAFRYRWQQCLPDLSQCHEIPGANAEQLRLAPAQLGAVVRVVVTAINSGGDVTATSAPSGVVDPRLPKPCVVPRLRGKTLPAARKALARAGCSTGRVRRARSSLRKGRVVAQSAKPGKRLKPRARVGVVVSLGRNS